MGLAGWQWLFIMESVPAVLLGLAVLRYMTDRPEVAKWLPEDEKAWLVQEIAREQGEKAAGTSRAGPHQGALRGMLDIRVLTLSLIYFGTSAGLYTLGIWAPKIIHELGVSSMTVGLLNAIPPSVSVLAMVLWARHSDRTGERAWHVIWPCLVAAAGLVMAASSSGMVGLILSLTLVNIGISCAKPPLWSMPTLFLSGPAAAAGIATINSLGNLGGFAGPAVIGGLKDVTGSFAGGLYFVAALLLVSALLTWVLSRMKSPA